MIAAEAAAGSRRGRSPGGAACCRGSRQLSAGGHATLQLYSRPLPAAAALPGGVGSRSSGARRCQQTTVAAAGQPQCCCHLQQVPAAAALFIQQCSSGQFTRPAVAASVTFFHHGWSAPWLLMVKFLFQPCEVDHSACWQQRARPVITAALYRRLFRTAPSNRRPQAVHWHCWQQRQQTCRGAFHLRAVAPATAGTSSTGALLSLGQLSQPQQELQRSWPSARPALPAVLASNPVHTEGLSFCSRSSSSSSSSNSQGRRHSSSGNRAAWTCQQAADLRQQCMHDCAASGRQCCRHCSCSSTCCPCCRRC